MARDKKKSFFSKPGAEILIFPNLIAGAVGTPGFGQSVITYPAATVEPEPPQTQLVTKPVKMRIAGAEDIDPIPANPIICPMKQPCQVTSSFNDPARGGWHPGVDLASSGGLNLYAVADGQVTEIFTDYDPIAVQKGKSYVETHPPGLKDVTITKTGLAMCGASGGGIIIGYSFVSGGVSYKLRYVHLASTPVDSSGKPFKVGDPVYKGQCLGKQDETGFLWGGHLHMEMYGPGGAMDPIPFFTSNGVTFPGSF